MSGSNEEHVALVGLAGRFPGAGDADGFWQDLVAGREAVRFPGDDELRAAGVPADLLTDPGYVKAFAEAPDLELFDADFFGFTPRDAAVLDPQIRMFLEVAHAAVENAGYDPHKIADGLGVYATAGANRYLDMHVRPGGYEPSSTGGLALSTLSYADYVATHVAYRFGFRGPALTVSTACSSSAVAIHLACQALRTGECDVALAGGAELEIPAHHGYLWDPGGPMSADGHCRPFDADATGTVFSSGGAAVLLKRLDDAVADGDNIWAVIRASAVNNDGAGKAGFSAPGIAGQVAVVREAMALAEAAPADMSYVEAHATGTALGDPIEVAALAKAYRELGPDPADPISLSSVKGNVGHLGHAAGVASLVKLALCLTRGSRVATANYRTPNPRLRLAETPFVVSDTATPWPRVPGRPRLAGLSSLGIGGTNVHLVVEEAPERRPVTAAPRRPEVVLWSARTPTALDDYRDTLADRLAGLPAEDFPGAVDVLHDGRTPHPIRSAVVAAHGAEAAAAMRTVRTGAAGSTRPVAFLFPGQAAQYPRMAAELYGTATAFTEHVDICLDLLADAGHALREAWLSGTDLTRTGLAQPLLFTVQYALARQWQAWGVRPAVLAGHSAGDLAAAAVAGLFSLPDAVRLVAARAEAMDRLPGGGMLAVAAGPEALTRALPDGLPPEVAVAVVNGPRQTVLSGPGDRLAAVAEALTGQGLPNRPVRTSHAFHSPAMAPAEQAVAAVLRDMATHEPAIPILSGSATGAAVRDPAFWRDHLTRPVRFDRTLDELMARPHLLLEIGPRRALSTLARTHPRAGESTVVAGLGGGEDEHRALLAAAAAVWVEGHAVDWAAVRPTRPARRVPLPGYPYERTRHWLPLRTQAAAAAPVAPETAAAEATPYTVLSWVERPRPATLTEPGVALALLPADVPASLPAVLALQQSGHRLRIARPGLEFGYAGAEYRVRPDHDVDLDRLIAEVAADAPAPVLLAHALALPEWAPATVATAAERVDDAFHAFAALVRAAARHTSVRRLLVLTTGAVDVTGAEALHPAKAALGGAVRSVALELPDLECRLVDLAAGPAQAATLGAEIGAGGAPPVVALRGPGRWVPVELPYQPAQAAPILRRDGVYLLTGGLGGLGLAVARELAATGLRPHLVLVGRTAAKERVRDEIAALESLGARVRVEACDIADRRATRRLLDRLRAHVGAPHGVVHLAGVPGGGLLPLRSRADAEAVLRPKVLGTLVLAELLREHPPLDFFVTFSSRAALNGLAGSADYAAANAFQDAYTRELARSGVPALSVNWPAWRRVGMAARTGPPDVGERRWEVDLRAEDEPVLDEHRLGAVPVLPGTGQLDLVVRAFRDRVGPPGTPVTLTEVVFQRVLDGSRPRRLTVLLRPGPQEWSFETSSTPLDGAGPRVVHASGAVRAGTAPPVDPPGLDVLRKRMPDPVAEVPDAADRHLFTLGPRWQSVERVTAGAEYPDELLVEIALAPPHHADLGRHPLHPALLDLATAEVRDPVRDGSHLPFRYGSLALHADLPARFTSHIRRLRGGDGLIVADVDLYAPDGGPLATIAGFTLRAVTGGGFLTAPDPDEEGLDPADGARLFRALLGGEHPFQVSVRPHRDGRPVASAGARVAQPVRHLAPAAPAPASPVAARGQDVAARLARLWTEVLGVPAVRPDDEFFELGGNSLTVVELMGLVREEFGVRMSVITMFDHPTLAGFARALAEQGAQ